jgi:2-methylisocitrate lyase-like PEP mutase family enzyme
VVGGVTPALSQERLAELGFAIALHANLPLLAGVRGMQDALRLLRAGIAPGPDHLVTWDERQRLVRRAEFADLENRYSEEER